MRIRSRVLKRYRNGKGYFGSDNKRQRTKQDETGDASDGAANKSRSKDIAFMEQIGWIENKQEAEDMIAERPRNAGDEAETKEEEPRVIEAPQAFDCSSIVAIGV